MIPSFPPRSALAPPAAATAAATAPLPGARGASDPHSPVTPLHLLAGLLACLAGLAFLHASAPPPPPPGVLTPASLARDLLGLPVVCFLPGLPLALLLFRGEGAPGGAGRGLDPIPLGLQAFAASVAAMILNFTGIKALGFQVTAAPLLGLVATETLAVAWFGRAHLRSARLRRLPRGHLAALALGAAILSAWAASTRPMFTVDLSHYLYSPTLDDGGLEPVPLASSGVQLRPGPGWPERTGIPFPASPEMELAVRSGASGGVTIPVWILVRAPVGVRVALTWDGAEVDAEQVVREVAEVEAEGPVERYWDWGIVELRTDVAVLPGDHRLRLVLSGFERAERGRFTAADARVFDLTNLDPGEAQARLAAAGVRSMHYYQLLNIAENVRWADEYTRTQGLTFNQPPLWSWIYASIRALMGPHLQSARVFLLLLLFAVFAAALRLVETESAALPALAAVPLALVAASHGRLMDGNGSANFPDNLFGLAILVAFLFAVRDQPRSFVAWALMATTLRYPGATVVVLSLGALALACPERRRSTLRLAVHFGGTLAAFCATMLLAGLALGLLPVWLEIIHFETLPEHFANNKEPLPVLDRPFRFLEEWGLFSGFLLPIAVLLRPARLARAALLAGLAYFPFLAFIDHFSHHYFLPLLPLAAVSAVAAALRLRAPAARVAVLAGEGVAAAAGLFLATRWGW